MTKRATIKDIAQAANVSIATVSRVLNNNPLVTTDTKKKVMKAARSLDYIPNSSAKSLKTHQTKTIGFVISDLASDALTVAARAAERVLAQNGYNMILCTTENDPDRELEYLRMLMSKNVDGIILNSTGWNVDYVLEINQLIPVVLYNRKIADSGFVGDLIDTNNFQGTYLLTKMLLQEGHRRIFLVGGPNRLSNAAERYQGYAAAMMESGIAVSDEDPYFFSGEFSQDTGAAAADYLVKMEYQPTAVICENVTLTVGFLSRAAALGLEFPRDYSFASYDGLPNAMLMKVHPTSVVFDTAEMGEQIGRSIIERIMTPDMPGREFIYDPSVIEGDSIAPAARI
ncbi:MAG: LacI family DNA-binding transcriptional regulator [Firmicutes bacterium]|nr:LacI family DNA-binding transcriptional regulator [Bacillota bacterium]